MRCTHSSVLCLAIFACAVACSNSNSRSHDPLQPAPSTPDVNIDTNEPTPPTGADGTPGAPAEDQTSYEPLFVGRFDTTDPLGPKAAWPGTRILARFEGTRASVTLSEFAEPWMDGTPSYWEYSIDRGPWMAMAMIPDDQPHVFELASDLPNGVHEIELFKRSETQTGITQFLGFDFHGGKSLPPPERQTRRIEVMGDSQTSGFGIEMLNAPDLVCPGANHGGVHQNFRKAWPTILGTRFDAEVHGIVYSGKGLIRNVWPTDNDPLKDYYPRTNPNPAIAQSAQLFDMQTWLPDVIVLTQGSVDFGAGASDGAFRSAYRDFVVNTLRPRSPNAHIFMGVLGMGGRGSIDSVGREIIAERAAVGDDRLHVFVAKPYTWDEMRACNSHGTPAWHQRIADELSAEIRTAMGW